MEDREVNVDRWVDERLAALESPAEWRPDSVRGLAAMHTFDTLMKRRRRKRILIMGASMAACLAVWLAAAPKAYCAGSGCAAPDKPAPHAGVRSFKESGSANAPLVCEIYSDYQCPACAAAFQNLVPQLVEDFVKTGKVRLLHRDFPLPMHPYARLAARYANAAGRVGEYDIAVAQLFKTQAQWVATGEIDAQLMQALPPGTMQKIRKLVNEDATLDDTVAADVAMAQQDQITGTPTMVIVANGKREKIPMNASYDLIRSYLDTVLSAK
jgi:protein-disulfide isomerase